MKKILYLLLISFSISSCSDELDLKPKKTSDSSPAKSVSKLSSGVNVKLFKAWTSYSAKYGFYDYTRRFQVEVRNLAFEKKVFIMHEMEDGSWKDFPLSYVSSTNENTEIWAADITLSNYSEPKSTVFFGDEFVARYEVKGTQYWDNNNNSNYKMGPLDGTYLQSGLNIIADTYYSGLYNYNSNFSVHVDVRNISYAKQVSVVYTTNGWATVQTAPLSFTPYLTVGAAQVLTSPNVHGMERWFTNITVPVSVNKIEYAVVYKVNGAEYWDNNFGKNYTVFRK